MNRRTFLKGLVAGTAGILIPREVMAEPERRIWALDSTMLRSPNPGWWDRQVFFHDNRITVGDYQADYTLFAKTTDDDWYSSDKGLTWRPLISVIYDDAI